MKRIVVLFLLAMLLGSCAGLGDMPGLSPLAAEFSGGATIDAVNFGHLPNVYSDNTPKAISFSLWVYPDAFGAVGVEKSVLSIASELVNGGLRIYFNSDIPVFHSAIFASPGYWLGPAYSTGAWQHIVITYDFSSTTNDPVFYKNGSLGASGEIFNPSGAEFSKSGLPIILGNRNNYGASYDAPFDGKIFDVRIYNRILTADEITAIYNSGTPSMSAGTKSGLVFQPFAVRTENLADYTDASLSGLKLFDAQYLAVGEVVGSVTGRAAP